jgi:hypothetical protein
MEKQKTKWYDWKNLLLMSISTAVAIAIIEIFLRVLFNTDQDFLVQSYQDKEFVSENKYWGCWHYPDNEVRHKKECFDAIYQLNSYGMKGPEIDIEDSSKSRIALLGDSYIEGYGKSNNQIIPFFLDSLLSEQYEVLNFGTSGGFGNVEEVALYENAASYFAPDIVVLFFLNYNDLYDNLKAVDRGLISESGSLTYPISNSWEETYQEISSQGEPETNQVDLGMYTFSLAAKGLSSFKGTLQYLLNVKFDFRTAIAQMYNPQETEEIKKGYEFLACSLSHLDSLVARDSAELLVVSLADPFQTDQNWLDFQSSKMDVELVPSYPNQRVKEICESMDIMHYDMLPDAMAEIKNRNMEFPYFFHTCDRHLSDEGNRFTAGLLYNYLKEKELIK